MPLWAKGHQVTHSDPTGDGSECSMRHAVLVLWQTYASSLSTCSCSWARVSLLACVCIRNCNDSN